MFGLPEHTEFYPEILNMLSNEDTNNIDTMSQYSCLNLFTKYEGHALERIVGTKHCKHMLKGDKSTYLFNS